jgi:hypothetical protein
MRRGEVRFHGGCVPEAGSSGTMGRCWLCGDEWNEENCCNEIAVCSCMAIAEDWREISYKNIVLLLTSWLAIFARPYEYFWERWYS